MRQVDGLGIGGHDSHFTCRFAVMPRFHFISGLPRSGSTLLAAILRQNPRFHAGMSSPVGRLANTMIKQVKPGTEIGLLVTPAQRARLVRGVFDSFYGDVPEDSVVFDTDRHWCARLPLILGLFPQAKVIACVRNVGWVIDSMERMYRANPLESSPIFGPDATTSTVYTRVESLLQPDHFVGFPLGALREAYFGDQARCLLVLDYDLLAQAPQEAVKCVYDFIGEPPFDHDFGNLEFDAGDYDAFVGLPGLHKVQPKVEFAQRKTVLPPDLFKKCAQLSFWYGASRTGATIVGAPAPQDTTK
jgi:sulfotransferase